MCCVSVWSALSPRHSVHPHCIQRYEGIYLWWCAWRLCCTYCTRKLHITRCTHRVKTELSERKHPAVRTIQHTNIILSDSLFSFPILLQCVPNYVHVAVVCVCVVCFLFSSHSKWILKTWKRLLKFRVLIMQHQRNTSSNKNKRRMQLILCNAFTGRLTVSNTED